MRLVVCLAILHFSQLLAKTPETGRLSSGRTGAWNWAIQKEVEAALQRQRLRSPRRLQRNGTKVDLWKDRRVQAAKTCSSTADCDTNDYCMSCRKCAEYHALLPKEQQRRWTCDPCTNDAKICESGKYCTVANDPAEGSCPSSYPGCSAHSDCANDEYCFSCQKCEQYVSSKGDNSSIWRCEPCPTEKGGFCSKLWWCADRQDSITGSCPPLPGCSKHSECQEGEYCEGCDLCKEFQASLPEAQRASWPCEPCPTAGGGICEPARLCQLANDGIDRTCPPEKGCNAHVQCHPDEYCMDCEKCGAYRDSLPSAQRAYWPCGSCPTGRGGHCERRVFCSVANDGVSDCPEYEGCFKHQDCKKSEFCWSWKACQEEDFQKTGNCGARPRKDGFCNPVSTCNTHRSIDGTCAGATACNSHKECGNGLFCVLWKTCTQRSPEICGPQPIHRAGVCLPVEHCVHGFHSPLGGECPAWSVHNGTAGGQLTVTEVLKLNSTLMLALQGQAINTWKFIRPHQEKDLVLAHLHDYQSNSSKRDDSESVGVYEVKGGKMHQQEQVQLSCPWVEIAIPAHGPRIYEARAFMDEMEMSQKHSECSCVVGESGGRCPRGAGYLVASKAPNPPDYCNSNVTVSSDPNSKKEILPENIVHGLRDCPGFAQVTTQGSFTLESPGASVRFLRMDSFAIEEVTIPESDGMKLKFDGQRLRCEAALADVPSCGGLHVNIDVPVVLQSFVTGSSPEKNTISLDRYCTACKPALKRFHPVFFYDENGQAVRNELSLYSMGTDMLRPAKLVDSRLSRPEPGQAESTQGCPIREAVTAKGVSLEELRGKKELPKANYTLRWCVVQTGGCSISSKVKYCIIGGASGVLVMEGATEATDPAVPVPDKQGQVYLSPGETLSDLVPVLYSAYDTDLWHALLNGEDVLLEAGPNVGVRPANSHAVSVGGVRIYDSLTQQWHFGGGGFGAERWMEHSQVRDVLFVCTASQKLIALDTSRGDYHLVNRGEAPESVKCERSSTGRDRHLLDIRTGPFNRFISVYVDVKGDRNHLMFFETSSLTDWHLLTEVHANWEHETDGLGQVVVTPDNKKLLITWQCSTIRCGTTPRPDGSMPGERVYVLDLTMGLEKGYAPPVLAAIKIPMSKGSIVRDIHCTQQNLCLLSLSWDGVAVIDVADGPNQFKVVAQHSASFTGWSVPTSTELSDDLAYLRMVVGAQKVVASRHRPNRFYIERWSFDMLGWSSGGKGNLMNSLRFDSVWAVDVENYVRQSFGSGAPPSFDPAVSAVLKMPKVSWTAVSARMEAFEAKMSKGLQEALHIAANRIKVLSSKEAPNGEGAFMEFTLLDGDGPAPETLLNALFRQVMLPLGAIHHGSIKDEVEGATIERLGPLPFSLKDHNRLVNTIVPPTDGFFRVVAVLAFVLLASCSLCFVVRSKNSLNKLREENRRLRSAEQRHTEIMLGSGPVGQATGYVIGRPDASQGSPSKKDPDARDTTGSLSYVVGNPINTTSPNNNVAPAVDSSPAEAELQPEESQSTIVRAPTKPAGPDERTDPP